MEVVEETEASKLESTLVVLDAQIQKLEDLEPGERPKAALQRAYKKRAETARRLAELNAAIRSGNVNRRARGRTLKGGALFLGAIYQYLRPVRLTDGPVEWHGGRVALVVDEAILNTPEHTGVWAYTQIYTRALLR